jgi:hypothetical protein
MTRLTELTHAGVLAKEEVEEEDVVGAASLLKYFKNHTRRVYTDLYGDSMTDRLIGDITHCLLSLSGVWEGTATEFYEVLDSDHKPQRPDDLVKVIKAIAKRSPLLMYEDKRTATRRAFRLTLKGV